MPAAAVQLDDESGLGKRQVHAFIRVPRCGVLTNRVRQSGGAEYLQCKPFQAAVRDHFSPVSGQEELTQCRYPRLSSPSDEPQMFVDVIDGATPRNQSLLEHLLEMGRVKDGCQVDDGASDCGYRQVVHLGDMLGSQIVCTVHDNAWEDVSRTGSHGDRQWDVGNILEQVKPSGGLVGYDRLGKACHGGGEMGVARSTSQLVDTRCQASPKPAAHPRLDHSVAQACLYCLPPGYHVVTSGSHFPSPLIR